MHLNARDELLYLILMAFLLSTGLRTGRDIELFYKGFQLLPSLPLS
jgi:hypothetical protein